MEPNVDTAGLKVLFCFCGLQLLESADGPQHGPVEVRAANPVGSEVHYVLRPEDWAACASAAQQMVILPGAGELHAFLLRTYFSDQEQAVLQALGQDALPGRSIARRCGVKHGTSMKLLLSNLVGRGVLHSGHDGYRLADVLVLKVLHRHDGRGNNLSTQRPGS